MRVAVLGAGGFIGGRLAAYLQQQGIEVIRLTRPAFDLERPEQLAAAVAESRCRALVHAAGPSGPEYSDAELWRVNAETAQQLGRLLAPIPTLERLLYLSTGGVFIGSASPVGDDAPPSADTPYVTSKLAAEAALVDALGERAVIARLFFPFGAGQRLPRLFPRLCQAVASGEEVVLDGAEGAVINPIEASDLARILAAMLSSPPRQYCNVGGSEVVSVRWMAEAIGRALGRQPRFRHRDAAPLRLYCAVSDWQGPSPPLEQRIAEAVSAAA